MKKVYIILFSVLFLLVAKNAFAAKGKAAVYKVTMSEVKLCTGNSSGTTCDGGVTIGVGDKTIDIASVDAGATAATYGDAALLPLGTTYTHMWVKISRRFIIETSDVQTPTDERLKTDNGDVCKSVTNADSMYDTNEATDRYTHVPGITEGGTTSSQQNAYLMNSGTDNVKFCINTTCGDTVDRTFSYSCAHCTAQKTDLDGDDNYHELIYALTTPYTVSLISPTITMSFGTAEALSANDVTGSICNITPEEPVFTVTIE